MEDLELKPLMGVMMMAVMLSIIPGMVGAKPGDPDPDQKTSIGGTIYDGDTDPLVPLDNATVHLVQTGTSILTGSNGSYLFSDLPLGTYTLVIAKQGYHDKTEQVYATEATPYTRDVVLLPVTVTPDKANLSGIVSSSVNTYLKVSGASVRLYSGTVEVRNTTTGLGGAYSFTELDVGEYTLIVDADNYYEKSIDVDLSAGDNTQHVSLNPVGVPEPYFEVSNLTVDKNEVYVGETVNVGVTVTNTGDATGTCVISTDPADDPDFVLGIGPGGWSPAAVVPTVYRPAIDITPIVSLMTTVIAMTMMVKIMSKAVK